MPYMRWSRTGAGQTAAEVRASSQWVQKAEVTTQPERRRVWVERRTRGVLRLVSFVGGMTKCVGKEGWGLREEERDFVVVVVRVRTCGAHFRRVPSMRVWRRLSKGRVAL